MYWFVLFDESTFHCSALKTDSLSTVLCLKPQSCDIAFHYRRCSVPATPKASLHATVVPMGGIIEVLFSNHLLVCFWSPHPEVRATAPTSCQTMCKGEI